jgi:hypothetical protein
MQSQHRLLTREEESIKFLLDYYPLKLKDEDSIAQEIGLYYLPFSTGFEIECSMIPGFDKSIFTTIPNIMEADVNTGSEQRFRIPNGLNGIKCLFLIAENMRKYAYPNEYSGIHYHIDCTNWFDTLTKDIYEDQKEYILTELDKWEYKGTYNKRDISFGINHAWMRRQTRFKTLEIRCGEMTFDYHLLFKRISHANEIVNKIRLATIETVITKYSKDTKSIINNRIIKI